LIADRLPYSACVFAFKRQNIGQKGFNALVHSFCVAESAPGSSGRVVPGRSSRCTGRRPWAAADISICLIQRGPSAI
jgi:hypothetical protein